VLLLRSPFSRFVFSSIVYSVIRIVDSAHATEAVITSKRGYDVYSAKITAEAMKGLEIAFEREKTAPRIRTGNKL